MILREEAEHIVRYSIQKVLPDEAVMKALEGRRFGEKNVYLVAVGKAAFQMAKTAAGLLENQLAAGIVITKYHHAVGEIPGVICYEAGHPVPDENSFFATQKAIDMVDNLNEEQVVLFLLSGGGSALFEKPLVSGRELEDITKQLLSCGANIVEINTIRKRLSEVKGGRFAEICRPAKVYGIVLSDIIGNPLDMIASGPVTVDTSTCEEALAIAEKYQLNLSENAWNLLRKETPKKIENVEIHITGSVEQLCLAAKEMCEELGYETVILTDSLNCEAREAGKLLGAIAKEHHNTDRKLAFIAGGETVVYVTGTGKGGRNQEIALTAAEEIAGLTNVAIFSVGSDGTDGPTDAAGGYCNGNTKAYLEKEGISIKETLKNNDAYHALETCNGLIFTGPTGTNVNDVAVVLVEKGN